MPPGHPPSWAVARTQSTSTGVVAGAPQHLDDVLAVLGPARLDRQSQLDLGDLQPRAVPRVQHLDDVRVRLGEQLGDPGELAGRSGSPTLR